ncbi:putative sterol carrier protein [Glaciihabitans sp. UYNi722]
MVAPRAMARSAVGRSTGRRAVTLVAALSVWSAVLHGSVQPIPATHIGAVFTVFIGE